MERDGVKAIHSYSSIYNVGHPALADFWTEGPFIVQEKVDGSQFSFMLDTEGVLHFRSKNQEVMPGREKMFNLACEQVTAVKGRLIPGWVYRGEYLSKPKHNTLAYDRVPYNNIILFDIEESAYHFRTPLEVRQVARYTRFESVPTWLCDVKPTEEQVRGWLERGSVLGGTKVEGLVFKPLAYDKYGRDKKVLMAKHVSEAFKERHDSEWKKSNPTRSDVVEALIVQYRTPARWDKSVYHLRDEGVLEGTPKDIGAILKEIEADFDKECKEEVMLALWKHFGPLIKRGVKRGFPEWYKDQLMRKEFGE